MSLNIFVLHRWTGTASSSLETIHPSHPFYPTTQTSKQVSLMPQLRSPLTTGPPAHGSPEVIQDQPFPLLSAVSLSLTQPSETGGRSFQAGKS